MLTPGVEFVTDPATTLQLLSWILGGAILGSVSGLVPGLHANNFALLLAGFATAVPGPPLYVGCAMLAAGVVHTFLNAVPAMALGVPDAEMAITALPGHRMVLEGEAQKRFASRRSAASSPCSQQFRSPFQSPTP